MKFKAYKIFRQILSTILITSILFGFAAYFPVSAAILGDEYSIANDYIKYTINAKTGGFCIETKDGHPLKSFDNNIPLLYKEDRSRSNGTSFTTIRIDGKDYIFGQEYGWFGIDTKLHEPVVSDEGRLLTVAWDIKGYTVTQRVAISLDENNPLCGNVGISYTISNNSGTTGNVGIRLLLDNALDSNIDAPYVMVNQVSPTIVETEYNEVPQQIRYMDSLSSPDKMAYALLDGWSGQTDIMVDKVIVGHWVNLANARYHYEPNPSCDFSNYSNEYLVPDTATVFYWSERSLNTGESRTAEMLYGIGNFAHQTEKQRLSIGMNAEKIELDSTKKAYANGGKFKLTVSLDNSVDGAGQLLEPFVTLSLTDGLKFAKTGTQEYVVHISGGLNVGSVYDIPDVEIIADKQAQITSKRIVAAVSATEIIDDATQKFVEYSSSINVLVPAVGGILPEIIMNQISPDTVYYEGDKNVTVSGDMKSLSEALAGTDGWSLYLVSTSGKESILIEKKNISFIDQGKTISFSTNEQLTVGKYDIEFRFTNQQLIDSFGNKIKSTVALNVSNDPRDRCVSYGIVSMIRFEHPSNRRQTYDFVSFPNEEALIEFTAGKTSKDGLIHKDIRFKDSSEILLTIRGKLRLLTDGDGKAFYQASKADGDITINNILTYCGDKPLKLIADQEDGAVVSGDGTIKVISSINVWHNAWEFRGENGTKLTLNQDEIEENNGNPFELSLVGAGAMIQYIGGFLIDLKYGVMTESDGLYGISFGGKITLPIKAPDKAGDTADGKGKDNKAKTVASDQGQDKDDNDDEPEDGKITAAVDDVLFGQKDDGIGFIGINTTLTVKLPEDVMGSMVKNAFGVEAEVTINTIVNYYRIALGLELTMLECEGVIAFKQVAIKSIPKIVPDELFFYLSGDIVKIPIVPPFVFMTGLGGGVADLADTVADYVMKELPPITIHLKTQLLLIETLQGDFELEVKLSGLKFDGELKLKGDDDGKIFLMNCGMSVRWVSPFYMSAYGDISICSGLLRGGFTIKISEDYFYGDYYVLAMLSDHQGGMSKVMSAKSFKFTNPLLPGKPEEVSLSYAGDGYIRVNVTNNSQSPGNYYMVSILDETGEEVVNSFGKYGIEDDILIRPMYKDSNEPVLEAGKRYFAKVITLREETAESGETLYYYSSESTSSPAFVMPDIKCAKLVEIIHNLPKLENDYTNNPSFEAIYTFDMPVNLTILVDGIRKNISDEYKTQWTVQQNFEDGLHIVDFEAVDEQGDTLFGSKSDGAIAFIVDTEAPVLSVGQTSSLSMDKDSDENTISNQTVFVSEDGSYRISGLTEKTAILTLDGTRDGISINDDGTFSICRYTNSSEVKQNLLLKAEDLAGNRSELQIYLVNRALSEYESIKLISDLENTTEQAEYIEMSIGHKTYLTAKGLNKLGESLINSQDIVWEVLYEHNIIKLSQEGLLEAIAPGETAVKVSYRLSAIEGPNGQKLYNELSDVIKIRIRDVGYRFELRQSQGFTLLTLYTEENLGMATVQLNEQVVTLLYDESKKAYMAAFRQRLTSEQLTDHILFDPAVKSPLILRGDINGNGIVDEVDVYATVNAILNNIFPAFDSGESWLKADKNGDGLVDISDAQLLLKEALR